MLGTQVVIRMLGCCVHLSDVHVHVILLLNYSDSHQILQLVHAHYLPKKGELTNIVEANLVWLNLMPSIPLTEN